MKRKLNTSRGGFTLVEIMIVVAIIALLATIAIPNFMRARKRSQASTVLEDLRILDQAKDQYAIEYNKKGTDTPDWTALAAYVKPTTPLYTRGGKDLFGKDYTVNQIDTAPKADTTTYDAFSDISLPADFWGAFGPVSGGTSSGGTSSGS